MKEFTAVKYKMKQLLYLKYGLESGANALPQCFSLHQPYSINIESCLTWTLKNDDEKCFVKSESPT